MPVFLPLTPEDYEDGVADLLAERFAGKATVERDVRLPSRSGGRDRQIDVLVRLPLADLGEELMVVDCKRYGTKVDKKDVEAFVGMVKDVGAPMGLLVTTQGFTSGAIGRAKVERGIRIKVIRVEDLPTWEPPLLACEFCRDSVRPDSLPGMVYLDREDELDVIDHERVPVTLGYCEKCGSLHVACPRCEAVNAISEWLTDSWVECEGGCGEVEFSLRRMMTKDDLTGTTLDRLTMRRSTDWSRSVRRANAR